MSVREEAMEQRHTGKGADPRPHGKDDEEGADGDRGKPDPRLAVLGFELRGGPWAQFFVCVAGVFGCGVTHDFVQELVFRYEAFDFGWFMTLWELMVFVVAAWLQLVRDGRFEEIRSVRWREYVNLTIVLAVTQGSGSVALSYVNFPIKVIRQQLMAACSPCAPPRARTGVPFQP